MNAKDLADKAFTFVGRALGRLTGRAESAASIGQKAFEARRIMFNEWLGHDGWNGNDKPYYANSEHAEGLEANG